MTDLGKHYHSQSTGEAFQTAQRHAAEEDITLFASCFCPFVQRAWVALEYLGIPYKYYEVDPYKKPKDLLELSPRGLVPALKLGKYDPPRALNESTVIMDYLEEFPCVYIHNTVPLPVHIRSMSVAHFNSSPLIERPTDARALVRLQADHVNRTLVPAFYRFLQAQSGSAQTDAGVEFIAALRGLVGLFERADEQVGGTGLWKEHEGDGELGWADIMVGPWMFRARNVLKHYCGFEMPQFGVRFTIWLNRLLEHPAFKRTCSTEALYIDSYERYAFNRPNTSQVADAINTGSGLP